MMLKITTALATILIITLLPLVLLANQTTFYTKQFTDLNVYKEFTIQDDKALNNKFDSVIKFVTTRSSMIDNDFFSEEDIKHLNDVRLIIQILYIVIIASLLTLVANYYISRKNGANNYIKGVKWGLISFMLIIIILMAFALTNFHSFFIFFHELVFWNEFWLLDPKTSTLIKFLPESIFYNVFLAYIVLSFALATLFIINSHLDFNLLWRNVKLKLSST